MLFAKFVGQLVSGRGSRKNSHMGTPVNILNFSAYSALKMFLLFCTLKAVLASIIKVTMTNLVYGQHF